MVTYCEKLFRGYLDKAPEYRIPSEGKAPASLNMRPTVSGVTIHEHGSEVALVVEGTDFWFCHRLSISRESVATPASKISGKSIKLNFGKEIKPTLSALSDNEEVSLKVFTHFMKSPVTVNLKVVKKVSIAEYAYNSYSVMMFNHSVGIPGHHKTATASTAHSLSADRGDLP